MVMELTAMAGMDFGIIDCEHGLIDYEGVYPMVLAAEARGMTAIARCPVRDPQFILRYLDLGVQGLHVPQINTKEEAEAFVQACRYQPRGWRGSASRAPAITAISGMSMYDAMQFLNREVLTIAHIENPRAVDNLEEICEVDGLDVLFVGRGDMSHALGVPNQFDHPSVRSRWAGRREEQGERQDSRHRRARCRAGAGGNRYGLPLYRLRLRQLRRRRDEAVPRGHQK